MIKHCYFQLLLLVVSLVSFHPCFSLQIKPIADNGAVEAVLSMDELTRIAVDHDRITRVRGLEGVYDMKNDLVEGAIFIRPLENQRKPFTVFLATERNRNYVLHLTPKDQAADTILLKPKEIPGEKAKQWENSLPYIKTLTSLVADMMKETAPSGYTVDNMTKAKHRRVNDAITTQLVRVYTGHQWQGWVYQLTNRHKEPVSVCEQDFYQRGDHAIALSNLIMVPHGQVLLYKVRRYE
jgi:type-F conjugative transfer system secretin TraK